MSPRISRRTSYRTSYSALAVAAGLALLAPSCGGHDLATDAGSREAGPSLIGSPCTRPMDPTCASSDPTVDQGTCSAGERCIPATCGRMDNGFPGGYCTQKCGTEGGPCPAGSTCITLPGAGAQRCMADCAHDTDCRSGYACQIQGAAKVCLPVPQTGGTNNGAACVTPPASLPSAGFGANQTVPHDPADLLDAEGNVDTDGLGHVAVSYIAVTASSSNMAVASYDLASGAFAASPQIFATSYSPGFTSDPVVAYDRTLSPPRLYLVWIDLQGSAGGNPTNPKVLVSWSDAHGAPGSWSAPVTVSPAADTAGGFLDKPWIVARNGQVVVTYDFQGAAAHIRVVRSPDRGATWAAPVNADAGGAFMNLATPVLDAAGDLFVDWFQSDATGSTVQVASQPAGATAFARQVDASGTTHQPDFQDPALAVSDDGKTVWTVWSDDQAATGDDLWAAVSHDGGATFSMPARVNDDVSPKAPAPCATHYEPAVALDAGGVLHVAWYDNRYLVGNVFYTVSTGDASFAPNGVVTDQEFSFSTDRSAGTWLGDYMGLALDSGGGSGGAGHLYATWSDPRIGSSLQYFASKALP